AAFCSLKRLTNPFVVKINPHFGSWLYCATFASFSESQPFGIEFPALNCEKAISFNILFGAFSLMKGFESLARSRPSPAAALWVGGPHRTTLSISESYLFR